MSRSRSRYDKFLMNDDESVSDEITLMADTSFFFMTLSDGTIYANRSLENYNIAI